MCDVWLPVVAVTALDTLLKSYSPAMRDCTYCLNRFFIPEFSQPYAAFLLRGSRHSLIANRLQCSQLVERSSLHAAFFAASNEFISFPLHSFARHQTHIHIHENTYSHTYTEKERQTQRQIERHCGRNFIALRPQVLARTSTIPTLQHRAHKLELQRVDDDIAKTQSPHSAESDRPSTNANANLNL